MLAPQTMYEWLNMKEQVMACLRMPHEVVG